MARTEPGQRHRHDGREHHRAGQVRHPDGGKNDGDGDTNHRWQQRRKLAVDEPPERLRGDPVVTVDDEVLVAACRRGHWVNDLTILPMTVRHTAVRPQPSSTRNVMRGPASPTVTAMTPTRSPGWNWPIRASHRIPPRPTLRTPRPPSPTPPPSPLPTHPYPPPP